MVAEGGEHAIVIAPESNRRVTEAEIDRFLAAAAPGDLLMVQNECSALAHALGAARSRGLRAWFNAAPADVQLRGMDLTGLDGLCVNETEAEALAGLADPAAALDALAVRLPNATVGVTLGAAGARMRTGGALFMHAGYRVRAFDTVGCGDEFVGAFLASLAATREGAIPSLPPRAAVASLAALPAGSSPA